jgi:L-fucose isomerase-like protein
MNHTLPTVGIRPTIDGRRQGVRESLEEQTMNMARSAARLIVSLQTRPLVVRLKLLCAKKNSSLTT